MPASFQSDICIVGAGIAGILIASRLAQSGKVVHLLEAGGLEFEDHSQQYYHTVIAGRNHTGAMEGRFRTFGGSSTRWGGQLLPYTEDVLHPASCLGLPSWPIELAELEAYYPEVERLMGVTATPYSAELLRTFGARQFFQSENVRLRFSKCAPFTRRNLANTLGRQCLDGSGIKVFTHANAFSVDLADNGTKVRSITVVNYGGVRYTFRADRFVLCTGTIETSRLLLASRGVCPSGVGNCRDQVGRYFHDHPSVAAAEIAPGDRASVVRHFMPYMRGGTLHKAKLEATAKLRNEERLLSVMAHFHLEDPEDSAVGRVRTFMQTVQRGRINRDLFQTMSGLPAASREIAEIVWHAKIRNRRNVSKRSHILLHLTLEQRPDPESRIRLATELDEIGGPKAVLDWKISEEEHETVRRYAKHIDQLFRENEIAELQWNPEIENSGDGWIASTIDTYHMMGGTRMGLHPASSVVNSSLCVHGVDNLYIASCAVFPTGGSSNPTFALMALALRLSDILKSLQSA